MSVTVDELPGNGAEVSVTTEDRGVDPDHGAVEPEALGVVEDEALVVPVEVPLAGVHPLGDVDRLDQADQDEELTVLLATAVQRENEWNLLVTRLHRVESVLLSELGGDEVDRGARDKAQVV